MHLFKNIQFLFFLHLAICKKRHVFFVQELHLVKRDLKDWKMLDTPLAIYVSYHSFAKYLPYSSAMYRAHKESSSSFQSFDLKIEFLVSKIKMKMFFVKRFDLSSKIYRKVLSSSFLSFLSIVYNDGFPKKSNKKVQLILFFYESIKHKKILKIK